MRKVVHDQIYRLDARNTPSRRVRTVRRSVESPDKWICTDLDSGESMLIGEDDLQPIGADSATKKASPPNGHKAVDGLSDNEPGDDATGEKS
jgi:hypothetical protein